MRKILITTAVVILNITTLFAQPQKRFCDLKVYQPGFKNYLAEANYSDSMQHKFKLVYDEQGDKKKFSSEIEVVNYFAQQGWELTAAYKYKGETHFFFKK